MVMSGLAREKLGVKIEEDFEPEYTVPKKQKQMF